MLQQLNTTANPFDQLRQEFKEEISELKHFISLSINGNNSIKNSFDDQDIIEIDEAANITKYSKSAIYKYLQRNEMPCIRTSHRKILFSKKALHEWLKQGRKLTLSEIQRQSEREPSPTP